MKKTFTLIMAILAVLLFAANSSAAPAMDGPDDTATACSGLEDFINHVSAQKGKKIPELLRQHRKRPDHDTIKNP